MPKSETSLKELLHEVKRIEENREKLTERKIKSIYRSLTKDLNAYLSEEFVKYADKDGRFYLSYLDAQNKRAKFLQEIAKNVDSFSPQLKKEILDLVDKTYSKSYERMVEAVKEAEKSSKLAEITKDIAVQPDVLAEAVNNNISKLTLPSVLEKYRSEIIFDIQQTLVIGLMNGDRYDQMAKRITERIGVNESKAKNIVRTESHRNIENGFMDCAENIQKGMDGSDYIYAATWHNMGDERVRPQQRRKTKKGWKTTLSKNGANHIVMEGQTVKVGDMFTLNDGVKTKNPSRSGYARHDCNCRCFLEYNLMTIEEFEKATGKPVNIASMHSSLKQQMNNNGIADLELQRTTDAAAFDKAIREMKQQGGAAACVDTHPLEEMKDFKLFLSKNQMAGVAVKPDGDITAVFKNADYKVKGGVNDLIITARANGGEKMDCYGSFLVNSYEKCGYVPVARVPFNADYVDDAYLLATKPDVYVLMKNSDTLEEVVEKNAKKAYRLSTQADLDNLPTLDYDDALKYRDELLEAQKKRTKSKILDYGDTDTTDRLASDSLAKYTDADGKLTEARELLHKKIIDDHFEGMTKPSGQATFTVMGGGSAAGKSTMIKSGAATLPKGSVMVDSDAIKAKLPDYQEMIKAGKTAQAAAYVHEESSALAKRIMNIANKEGYNVVLDGTGDGSVKSLTKKIMSAKQAGLKVEGIYATVPTNVAVERSMARAAKTGRTVPTEIIKGTHKKVSQILPECAELFDDVKLFDTTDGAELIATGGNGKKLKAVKGKEDKFADFIKKADE